MADSAENTGGLPPKLDLKKSGILKTAPTQNKQETTSQASEGKPSDAPKTFSAAQAAGSEAVPAAAEKPESETPKRGEGADARKIPTTGFSLTPKAPKIEVTPVSDAPAQEGMTAADGPEADSEAPTMTGAPSKPAAPATPRPPAPAVTPEPLAQTHKSAAAVPKPRFPSAPKAVPAPSAKPATPAQPASPAAAKPAEAAKQEDAKKKTTRIPLEAAKPALAPKPAAPKTIRIEPVSAAQPKSAPSDRSEAATASAEKRKTSRISLEAVLSGESDSESEGGPKTIRLKRPGDTSRAKITAVPKTVRVKTPAAAEEQEPDVGEAPTVRKTVRVKRPTGAAGRPSISVSRPEAEVSKGAAPTEQAAVQKATGDRVSPLFPLLTLAALLVVCAIIYMFCAQAFGPNFSLTQYSYAKGGPDLPWPGKLSPTP